MLNNDCKLKIHYLKTIPIEYHTAIKVCHHPVRTVMKGWYLNQCSHAEPRNRLGPLNRFLHLFIIPILPNEFEIWLPNISLDPFIISMLSSEWRWGWQIIITSKDEYLNSKDANLVLPHPTKAIIKRLRIKVTVPYDFMHIYYPYPVDISGTVVGQRLSNVIWDCLLGRFFFAFVMCFKTLKCVFDSCVSRFYSGLYSAQKSWRWYILFGTIDRKLIALIAVMDMD